GPFFYASDPPAAHGTRLPRRLAPFAPWKKNSPAGQPGCAEVPTSGRAGTGGIQISCRTSTWLGRIGSEADAAGQSVASLPGAPRQTQAYFQRSCVRCVSVRAGRSARGG